MWFLKYVFKGNNATNAISHITRNHWIHIRIFTARIPEYHMERFKRLVDMENILKIIRCVRVSTSLYILCFLHSKFFVPPIKTRLECIISTIYTTGRHKLSWYNPHFLTIYIFSRFLKLTKMLMISHWIHPAEMMTKMMTT